MQKNNLKLKIFFLATIFCGVFGLAESSSAACSNPCVRAGTIWTCADINQDCVQEAINASEANWNINNEIQLATGEDTWTDVNQPICDSPIVSAKASLCIHRGVKLTGGIGGTTKIIITGNNYRGAIWFIPFQAARQANETLEVSGITFDGLGVNFAEGIINFTSAGQSAMSGFKIHNNNFLNTGHAIGINGIVSGVIYKNIFDGVGTSVRNEGANYSWNIWKPVYGTADSVFFEDNTMINSNSTNNSVGSTGCGQGGSMVERYNTYDFNNVLLPSNQWYDRHGLQSMTSAEGRICGYDHIPDGCLPEVRSCQQWSQLKSEIYGNISTNFRNPYSGAQELMRLRGSGLLMFNNRINGTGIMPLPDIYQYSCDSCQSGDGPRYSMHVQNTYLWNNIGDNGSETNLPIFVIQDDCGWYSVGTPYAITENIDFWNYNSNVLNGSTEKGINCGSVAPTSACSVGDGYWQTDYSPCYKSLETMADMKTYTQSGKFYKCTAPDTWTLYYQPYIYPHPLRNEGDITGPSAPGGLNVS